jgi:hypothetical protein
MGMDLEFVVPEPGIYVPYDGSVENDSMVHNWYIKLCFYEAASFPYPTMHLKFSDNLDEDFYTFGQGDFEGDV